MMLLKRFTQLKISEKDKKGKSSGFSTYKKEEEKMGLNFLSKERVMDDHERFAKDINDKYNVDSCTVLEQTEGENVVLGFDIQKDNTHYEVRKQFAENEAGEIAILNNSFEIKTNGAVTHSNLYSLQNVFDAVGIEKTPVPSNK